MLQCVGARAILPQDSYLGEEGLVRLAEMLVELRKCVLCEASDRARGDAWKHVKRRFVHVNEAIPCIEHDDGLIDVFQDCVGSEW